MLSLDDLPGLPRTHWGCLQLPDKTNMAMILWAVRRVSAGLRLARKTGQPRVPPDTGAEIPTIVAYRGSRVGNPATVHRLLTRRHHED